MDTKHNEVAIRYLKSAQHTLKMNNREFATALSNHLGLRITESTFSYIASGKTRRKSVPAAFLIAAAELSRLPLLDGEEEPAPGGRLGRIERLERRMDRLEAMLRKRADGI